MFRMFNMILPLLAVAIITLLAPIQSASAQGGGGCTPAWLPGDGIPGLSSNASAMTMWDPDGAGPQPPLLVAGGFFTAAGSVTANRVAHWNGTAWSALGTGMNSAVSALTVLPNGDLVAGGSFTLAGGVPASRVARWNGTAWSALGSGMNFDVYALAVLPNGDLVAGGNFTTAGGQVSPFFARYTFGTPAPTIITNPQNASTCPAAAAMFAVTATAGVTGSGAPGPNLTYQWRKGGTPIDASSNPSAATATLMLSNVQATDAVAYDCVISNTCGSVTSNAATLTICAADFNCDGNTDPDDLSDYITCYFAAPPCDQADFNGDGYTDPDDLAGYIDAFFAGCP